MKVLELSNGKVTLFESIKEMPIGRYADFQKYLVQDLGIGSTMEDVAKHYGQLYRFLGEGMTAEAGTEASNLWQNIFLMLNKINIGHLSFACFVFAINGNEIRDTSEQNLLWVCEQLGVIGVTQGDAATILEDLKKKLTGN